ncbi:MAG: response regulator [Leptolyngbyaceae cyanobacterium bins.302]|nr:response regulator [Leptolyngbyaceae cyanobacterium bins.302]
MNLQGQVQPLFAPFSFLFYQIMKTILVIDDNESFRLTLAEWLRFEGFHPLTAENGSEGIRLARDHAPNLILCDFNMPDINGVEVLKQLRNDLSTSRIPFFFFTSDKSLNPKYIQQLGANGILEKDAEIYKLRQVISVACSPDLEKFDR